MRGATRLVPPAVAAWVAAVILVSIPSAAVPVALIALVATCITTGVAVARARHPSHTARPVSPWWAWSALVLLAVFLAATAVAARAPSRTPDVLTDAADAGRLTSIRLVVTEKSILDDDRASPWERRADAPGSDSGESTGESAQRIRGTVTEVHEGGSRVALAAPVVLFATVPSRHPVPLGAVIEADTSVRKTAPGDAAAFLLFARQPATVVEGAPWYLGWAADLRAGLVKRAAELPGRGGELLPGLSVGDTTAVSDELDTAMKTSALSHLTAVSGANCAVIVAVLTLLLAAFSAPRWLRISGALVGLGLFVVLVTPEPSVIRAGLMALAVLLALGAGRPTAGLPVLSLVVIVIVVSDPWLSRSFGFVLSALATGGLLLLTRPLTRWLSVWLPRPLAAAFAIPLAAQIACQPVLLLLNPDIPVLGVPANLLAAPAAPVATLLGLAACLLVPAIPVLATVALWLGWLPATWIAAIAATVDRLPVASVPWLPGAGGAVLFAVLTATGILAVLAVRVGRRTVAAVCTGVLVIAGGAWAGTLTGERLVPAMSLPQDWSVAACDVGQGDAILIRSAGAVALIDTGVAPDALTACLDTLAIGTLDLVILTHFDLDHVGGVDAIVGKADLVLTGRPENAADERMLDDLAAGGATVRRADAGMSGTLGTAHWRVLWPPPRAGPLWTGNAASVTVVVEPAEPDGIRSLFLGDLDERAQKRILAGHGLRGPVDLVKVAHHGSADQSARMYEEAAARIGLVPVGADNDYGHPAPDLLDMLAAAGTTPLRTDLCGLIVVGGTAAAPVVWTEMPC
ncbi:ComEC/Rec2 family competence protein [Mycetocola manganoxydans]|uniref:ComEC/Rec2 family competence protein n=1 Tax=Mycetocola manganoxydans TaxID=699879 RepID=UPI0015FECC67|nr:ComEC/Rec2 family competence protein [Mycetocola manganoxydans]